jgi:hypothetical protein
MITTKAVMNSLVEPAADVESLAVLSRFRPEFRTCLAARGDELFELADAMLCAALMYPSGQRIYRAPPPSATSAGHGRGRSGRPGPGCSILLPSAATWLVSRVLRLGLLRSTMMCSPRDYRCGVRYNQF